MFQTLHEISKNLIFVFVWKYVWKYVNINVSDIKKKKKSPGCGIIGHRMLKNIPLVPLSIAEVCMPATAEIKSNKSTVLSNTIKSC